MKRLLGVLMTALCVAYPSYAQQQPLTPGVPNLAGILYASNFAQWQVPQGNTGEFSWSSPTFCKPSTNGLPLNPVFRVGTPVKIVDSVPAHDEVVVPTQVNVGVSSCSF